MQPTEEYLMRDLFEGPGMYGMSHTVCHIRYVRYVTYGMYGMSHTDFSTFTLTTAIKGLF